MTQFLNKILSKSSPLSLSLLYLLNFVSFDEEIETGRILLIIIILASDLLCLLERNILSLIASENLAPFTHIIGRKSKCNYSDITVIPISVILLAKAKPKWTHYEGINLIYLTASMNILSSKRNDLREFNASIKEHKLKDFY